MCGRGRSCVGLVTQPIADGKLELQFINDNGLSETKEHIVAVKGTQHNPDSYWDCKSQKHNFRDNKDFGKCLDAGYARLDWDAKLFTCCTLHKRRGKDFEPPSFFNYSAYAFLEESGDESEDESPRPRGFTMFLLGSCSHLLDANTYYKQIQNLPQLPFLLLLFVDSLS